ncbi:MAG: lipopolysaccharide biosynthesis protein [Chloroflexota bacterium]
MNYFQRQIASWRQDNLLHKVLRNTGYLFAGNTLSTVVQSIFAARLLGVLGFGILGTVISLASNVNRLLSFRMGELVVKYVGEYLAQEKKEQAAAVFKAALLMEAATSIIAYLLLLLIAPLAATYIVKDPTSIPLFTYYGLALLANFATESATGLLQVGDHFRSQAVINLIQSLLTAGLIVYAYLVQGSIWMVLTAYLVGKTVNGLALAGYALWRARDILGRNWWRVPFKQLPLQGKFLRFAISTNLSGTVNLITRDSEVIWVAYFLSPLEAGYYKLALAVINLVVMPITPFINTSFPEITRAVAQNAWARLRGLLKKLTLISAAWTFGVTAVLAVAGSWLIAFFYGVAFVPAIWAVLILLIGYGCANIFFWNRNLLLAFGDAEYPLKAMAVAGIAKISLAFFLVPRYGYLMEAGLLSAFFVISIGLIVWRGMRLIHRQTEAVP